MSSRAHTSSTDTALPAASVAQAKQQIETLITSVSQIILGKEDVVRLATACLLARGHLLFEDQPGVGKTILSQALANALGLQFRRVQFTSDLLPADILGAAIFERDSGTFIFHRGPVFSQVLLADEINRATPKTQSALLEAMEEGRVSADFCGRGGAEEAGKPDSSAGCQASERADGGNRGRCPAFRGRSVSCGPCG